MTTCSMATCSMVLLSVLKTAGSLVSEREEAAFMAECHQFATRCVPLMHVQPPAKMSGHGVWASWSGRQHIESLWCFSARSWSFQHAAGRLQVAAQTDGTAVP